MKKFGNLYFPTARMDDHKKHLKNRCRVCGRKGKGYMHNKNSDKCKAVLLNAGVAVDSDAPDIHPEVVCNSCYITLGKREVRDLGFFFAWSPHTESCHLCSKASDESSGGRPRKRSRTTEEEHSSSLNSFLHTINGLDLPPQYTDTPLELPKFLASPILQHLTCKSCSCIPNQPVELLTCRHLHCKDCIVNACRLGTFACSCDSSTVNETQLRAPSTLTCQLLEGLLVKCSDCIQVMELKNLTAHLKSKCSHTVVPSPSSISVQQLLEQDHTTPSLMASQAIGQLMDKVIPASGSITCKTHAGRVRIQ